jgi:5-epi-alpha-selinene synthase
LAGVWVWSRRDKRCRSARRVLRVPGGEEESEIKPFTIPELYCPFPSAVNPHADEVNRHTVEWMRRFRLVADEPEHGKIHAVNIGRLAGRFHPEAPRDALQLVSDWYAWMFLQDDRRDESEIGEQPGRLAAVDTTYLDILRGEEPVEERDPLAHALWDLQQRLEARSTATWMRRFIRSVREYFESTIWEATNRARGITPDLASYIRMRPLTGGFAMDTELIEIIERTHLPPEVRDNPVVRRMALASSNVVCWANDIISFEKEVAHGDVHNLISVLQHEHKIGVHEAVERAAGMHDSEVRKFMWLERNVPSFGGRMDVNLALYISTLRSRMRGYLDWSEESERYRRSADASTREDDPLR